MCKRIRMYKEVKGINKYIGLMFKSKDIGPLVFKFEDERTIEIHSLFVFFPFIATWINKKGEIVDQQIIKPFTLNYKPKHNAWILIEEPL